MDHQASLRKAIMDSNKISESLTSLSEVIAKYDVLLASKELTPEQEEMKKELHNTVLTKVREIPLQALTPLIVKRDDIRRDIVLTMSASMVLMVGQVLAAEYNTTLIGLFEILKGTSVDVDNIIVDYVEGIASYIRKVAIHQHNNPFISTDSENNQIIDSEGLRACHEAGGTNTGDALRQAYHLHNDFRDRMKATIKPEDQVHHYIILLVDGETTYQTNNHIIKYFVKYEI